MSLHLVRAMTRLSLALLVFLFCLNAQVHPNFTGVWEVDKAQLPAQGPDSMRGKIEQHGSSFTVTLRVVSRGTLEQQTNTYIAGQETKGSMHGAPMTSNTEWDGPTLVVHSVAVFGGKELRTHDRWTLSPDGNTLTITERHQFGSEPEGEDTRVLHRKPASTWEPDAPPKLAGEVYKNIQILNAVPASEVRTIMAGLTKALGVDCAHCHVPGAFEKDDKAAKQTARGMFKMVRSINQQNFRSANAVSCWTCHRGATKPQSLPPG